MPNRHGTRTEIRRLKREEAEERELEGGDSMRSRRHVREVYGHAEGPVPGATRWSHIDADTIATFDGADRP